MAKVLVECKRRPSNSRDSVEFKVLAQCKLLPHSSSKDSVEARARVVHKQLLSLQPCSNRESEAERCLLSFD